MIIEAKKFDPGTILESAICIVGSGPAAISLALGLLEQRCKIIMLAGGSWTETPENRELNKGFADPVMSHEPLEENRARVFGGASSLWGGRCLPLDPIDFKERSWVPHSGWPITYEELASYYPRSLQLCEAGENNFDARTVFPDKDKEIIPGLDNEDMVSNQLERWSPPTRFAHKYREILENDPHVFIYFDAHVTNLHVQTSADKIDYLTVAIGDSIIKVVADKYIIATGGIENPRLLLASKSAFHPNGIGNQHDNVGRYYMSHLIGTFGSVDPTNRKEILFPFELDREGISCRRRWWLTPKVQQQEKVGNAIMYLHRSINVSDGHKDPMESAIFVAKTSIGILKQKSPKKILNGFRQSKKELKDNTYYLLKNTRVLIPSLFGAIYKRIAHKKEPLRLPSVHSKWLYLYFQTEHMPNPESRVTLSDTKDRLGVPVPVVKVAFSELDIETIFAAHKIFFGRFEKLNKGKMAYKEEGLRQFILDNIENFNSVAHHLGTTKMSENPSKGVVDKNCKVHGMSNLYMAGSSVFPTGGHANPTVTIIALALRLADHLKKNTLDFVNMRHLSSDSWPEAVKRVVKR